MSNSDGKRPVAPVRHDEATVLSEPETTPGLAPVQGGNADPSRQAPWGPGTLLCGRYRVVRFIARGGMGEVYEVLDQELGDRVALKTLLPHGALNPVQLERFRREIQLARRVTHPNVSRVFDLVRHESPDGSPPLNCLTMELLQGVTLDRHLRKTGPLDGATVLPILDGMAAGLHAAHKAGIVHRDFKSGNVMLAPTLDGGTRAVVTDFGLAHSAQVHGEGLTQGGVPGTPAYMAPEQLQGHAPSPSMDLYALGVVLFELCTGKRPFASATPMMEAARRLHEPPPRPRDLNPALGEREEAVILRCLALKPEDRFATALDVAQAFRGEPAPVAAPAPAPAPPARRSHRWLAAGLLLSAGLALAFSAVTGARRRPAPHHAVAVLGFRNVGGSAGDAWLSTALAEMLNTELSGVPSLRVVAGEEVARMKGDLSLADEENLPKDTLLRVGRHLGSDVVVVGSYQLAPGPAGQSRLRLDLKALDTALGDTLVAVDETGPSEELLELVERAGNRLRSSITNTSPGQAPALRNILPHNPRAAQLYTTGLERLRAFDPLKATELLQQAANLEPAHPTIHRELANAWRMLGYDEMALREAQKAFDLSAGLPPGERLLAEARLRQLQRDWEPALTLMRKARDLDPDNLDVALRLMHAQTSSSRPAEALGTLQVLQQLPQAAADPRVDLAEANAAESLGDFKRSLAAARRAQSKAQQSGARLVLASARLLEANALRSLGEPDGAIEAATAARQAFEDAGDNRDAAEAVNLLGNVRLSQGRLPEARALYQQALTTMENIGNKRGQGVVVNNLGLLLDQQGNHKESARMSERALRIAEETGDPMVMSLALQNVANQLLTLGDLDGARANYGRAAALDTSMGNASGAAMTRTNLASVLYAQGALREAAQVYAEVEKTFEEAHNPSNRALALAGRADVATLQGNFAEARALYEAAGTLRDGLHEKGNVALTRESLAQLELWQDHGEAAAALLTDILPVFQEEGMVEDVVFARLFLVEALLLQGKLPQARRTHEQARALLRRENLGPQVDTASEVAGALLKAAQGKDAEARKVLQKQLAQARAGGQHVVAWDIRFRLLEVEAHRSQGPAFLKQAATLASEARSAGMGATASRIQSRWLKTSP